MKTLIASLAEYARFFKTPAHFFRIDTNGLLKKVLADLAPEIAACGAKVEIRGSSVIKAEPQQMEYAVRCLILNAFKFAKPGAAPAVTIESRAAGPVTEILVSDEGIGFAPDSAETVFEPFRTLHPKDQYEGTGIGLSIVRRIVQNHGGGITASAAPGKGATFMITLPND
jgi:light-regulated signal transduction histidine kinase (bacteriophytochrome)